MARKRDPRRNQAFELWKASNGERKLKDIAEELDCSPSQIRKWKSQDKWNEKLNGNVTKSKGSVTNKKETNQIRDATDEEASEPESLPSDELTDKQRLFCVHYIKTFNATQSAIKAGYAPDSAHVEGSRLLRNAKVREYILDLKSNMTDALFLDAMDVLRKYAEIAFADITDFVTFTRKDVDTGKKDVLLNQDGTVKDIVPRVDSYNEVFFKDSELVDGTIVTEVKHGRDGVSVKLADKMKALDKLWQYFDMLPEADKRKLQEEKMRADIAKTQAETEAIEGSNDDKNTEDWVGALKEVADRRREKKGDGG
ncbi:terminase small subunit [Halobacillus litoralis]|uniref:Terminase n=1 Tax=Halobacillus litoralis TaxID=45668 RepID=A0A410MCG6_9BACI|nr:terminase small subunit [Halobacillus litoralis]QAS52390.1 terminase [Halobacillus litoralis]